MKPNEPPRLSIQDEYAPKSICFGCGPANEAGLRIKSFVRGELTVATFVPQKHHQSFPGMLNGGIVGTLFDCHMNWTAAWHLMQARGLNEPPCTVTGCFEVSFQSPTPADQALYLESRIVELGERKAVVAVTLVVGEQISATGQGTFVAVNEGHPAFGAWQQA